MKLLFLKYLYLLGLIQLAFSRSVRTECTIGDWVCNDGQCIPINYLCDGKVDCSDRSDEIAENCIQKICSKDTFRCAYGGCVSNKDKCNRVTNCTNSSDESICPEKSNIDIEGTCAAHQRQCLTSKECVDKSLFCNGISNCQDGSDESPEVCLNLKCPEFQCGNGTCISEKLKCNGKAECLDGSDEGWQLCNKPQKANNFTSLMPWPRPRFIRQASNCLLPNFPELQNLKFMLHPRNETISLGQFIENYEIVYVECKNDGTLIGSKSLLCRNGDFTPDFPNCNYCDGQLLNKLSLRVNCIINRVFQNCPNKILPGTSIRVICAYGYSRQPSNELGMKCLENGKFDQIVPSCNMTCGRVAHNSRELSKNGIPIVVSDAPWHVAIYENLKVRYVYICGGSVISPTIIISAAHCFYDEAGQVQKDSKNFQVIAGRDTSLYSPEQTEYAQVVNVIEVCISPDYKGREDGQINDIAFLKLEVPLQFSKTIAPICLDNSLRSRALKYMRSNRVGFMAGYGANNYLERVNMKTLEFHECKLRSPIDSPVVDDKFCAYPTHNAFVCRGDSGGGFVTGQTDEDSGVTTYTFWGVISNTPIANSECTRADNQSFVAITNIFFTDSTFKRKLTDARRQDELLIENPFQPKNCYIPNTVILRNVLFKERRNYRTIELGSSVEDLETIHAECKNGGTLSGASSLTCRNGEWNVEFPRCASMTLNCPLYSWECHNGQCIKSHELCDGNYDCADRSDETVEECLLRHNPNLKCNGIINFVDRSDENKYLCQPELNYGREWQGNCTNNNVCNGFCDCLDGSDEIVGVCSFRKRPENSFRCGYGACIPGVFACNHVTIYRDGSDELSNVCSKITSLTTTNSTPSQQVTSTTIKTLQCSSMALTP